MGGRPRRSRLWLWFGALDIALGAFVAYAVFALLPARYLPIDVGAVAVVLLLAVAGVGLVFGAAWARRLAMCVCGGVALVGMLLVTLLSVTVAHLAGSYGTVGSGGAAIFALAALLVLAYLVAFPAAQLVLLGREPPS